MTDPQAPNGQASERKYSEREITPELQACFPTGGVISSYMKWACRTTYADPFFHLASILPCIAYELNRRGWQMGERREPLRILTAIVAGSGTAKSTAVGRARHFMQDWLQQFLGPVYKDPFLQANGSMQGITHSLLKHWHDKVGKTLPIFYLDELSALLRLTDTADIINQLWDGRDFERHLRHLQRDEKAKDDVLIRAPVLMGTFCGTEAALEEVVRTAHFGAGLFSRMLWFRGEDSLPEGVWQIRHSARPKEREVAMGWFEAWGGHLTTWEKRGYRRVIHLDEAGLDFIQQAMAPLVEEFIGSRVGGVMARLGEYTQTVAALYAMSRGEQTVEQDDAVRAANLVRHCQSSILQLDATLGVTERNRDTQRVEAFLRAAGGAGMNKRELYIRTRLDKKQLGEAIDQIIDNELAVAVQYKPPNGGRPGLRFFHADFCTSIQ